MPRGPFSRLLPASWDPIPHTPPPIPYHSLECLLSISLRAPSWAGAGACGVLPLRRASWHMPVVGAQRVTDFPPAWGEVGVCLQALVAPEVVCADGTCETRGGGKVPPAAGCPEKRADAPIGERVLQLPLGGWLGTRPTGLGKAWREAREAAVVADPTWVIGVGSCLIAARRGGVAPAGAREYGQPEPAKEGTLLRAPGRARGCQPRAPPASMRCPALCQHPRVPEAGFFPARPGGKGKAPLEGCS